MNLLLIIRIFFKQLLSLSIVYFCLFSSNIFASNLNKEPSINPAFMPEGHLFKPLIADIRWPHFSVTYLYQLGNANIKSVGSISFGQTLNIYKNKAFFEGEWMVGLQAAVFAIFDLAAFSKDLVNADYWVALPLSYRRKSFSALFRISHQSSHLGDEFLLNNNIHRVNFGYESLDLKISYDATTWARIYIGGSVIYNQAPKNFNPGIRQIGLEIKSPWTFLKGFLRPVTAADFTSWEEHDWDTDISFRAGFQFENEFTEKHKILLLLELFSGNSPHGQFFAKKIRYTGFGLHFYY